MQFGRPKSLRQVSEQVAAGYDYVCLVKECLDELIAAARVVDGRYIFPTSFFADEPLKLADPVHMAHLAGMAEHMASLTGAMVPDWVERPGYFLPTPVYFGGQHARAAIIAETPQAFARRGLYCGAALAKLRARMPIPEEPMTEISFEEQFAEFQDELRRAANLAPRALAQSLTDLSARAQAAMSRGDVVELQPHVAGLSTLASSYVSALSAEEWCRTNQLESELQNAADRLSAALNQDGR